MAASIARLTEFIGRLLGQFGLVVRPGTAPVTSDETLAFAALRARTDRPVFFGELTLFERVRVDRFQPCRAGVSRGRTADSKVPGAAAATSRRVAIRPSHCSRFGGRGGMLEVYWDTAELGLPGSLSDRRRFIGNRADKSRCSFFDSEANSGGVERWPSTRVRQTTLGASDGCARRAVTWEHRRGMQPSTTAYGLA